jgi:hypothetical protein
MKFLVVDTNGIDFVNNKTDFEELNNIIFNIDYDYGINRKIL